MLYAGSLWYMYNNFSFNTTDDLYTLIKPLDNIIKAGAMSFELDGEIYKANGVSADAKNGTECPQGSIMENNICGKSPL